MEVKTKGLTKNFGSRTVVADLNIEIKPGQILGLLGPNGAGKSTTIKMLTGQLTPTSGTIILDGEEYSSIPLKLRGSIGVMPQEIIVWENLTIKENLHFTATLQNMPHSLAEKRVADLVTGLKLERELNTLTKNLSGGYRRRVNLAISLIHDPSLIFLDEPSPGVDAQTRRFLWDFIKQLRNENHAIVLTDHYLEEAEKLSDYVVIIDEGKVIAEGTVAQLKAEHGDGTVIKIKVEADVPEGSIKNALSKLPFRQEEITNSDHTISIITTEGVKSLQKVTDILAQEKVRIENISLSEPSLEDVFLLLTGKEIRE